MNVLTTAEEVVSTPFSAIRCLFVARLIEKLTIFHALRTGALLVVMTIVTFALFMATAVVLETNSKHADVVALVSSSGVDVPVVGKNRTSPL